MLTRIHARSGKSASGVSAIDKLDLILSETRSASKSFAKDVLKSPARVLPAKFMDQYLKRTSVLESDTAAPAQNDHTANPDNTDVVKKRDILEERTSSEAIDFQAQKTLRSRHLWRLAWNGVTIGRWFIRFYYEMRAREASMKRATVMEAEGVAFLLSSQMAKPDMVLAAKLKELTSSPERSEADVEALERILSIRQRAFGRFTTDQRLKFCRILKYEHHTADRIVVREGHVSWAFYFILSGQVEIFKVKNGLKYRLNVMNAGASFGDRTMNMLNDKRTASVATTTETELIRIDKSDFFDV